MDTPDAPRRCPTCLRRLGPDATEPACPDCADDDGGTACPFCSRPESWGACPIHAEGQDEDGQ